jgi:hypothetical protein
MNRALLVGINAYPSAPLQGCVNDVTDFANFLVKACGFKDDEIRLLVDGRATTDAIRDRLAWLVTGAQPGDRLFFQYSGHGTQLAPRNRAGRVVGLHDCICPVDFDFTPPHALTDADFKLIFAGLSVGVEFNWVSDSCHSGDLAKLMPHGTSKNYPMPADLAWHVRTARSEGMQEAGLDRAIEHLNGAFISGCRSDQTSSDASFNGRPNGALTYFLLQTLSAKGGLSVPLKEVVPKTAKALQNAHYEQVPQIRGRPDVTQRPFLAPPGAKTKGGARASQAAAVQVPTVEHSVSLRFQHSAIDEAVQILQRVFQQPKKKDGSVSVSVGAGPGGPTVNGTVTVHF